MTRPKTSPKPGPKTSPKTSPKTALTSDAGVPKHAALVLVVAAVMTLGLPHVPVARWLAWPLVLVSTVAHELGHGIAGLLVGGSFEELVIRSDASGHARVSGQLGRLARGFISAGGLVGPAITSMGLFLLARRERWARYALGAIVLGLVLTLVFFSRNLFGFAFIAALTAVLFGIVRWGNATVARFTLVFLAVNLAVSVFTRGDYLFTRSAGPGLDSDVQNMSDALFLPYFVWGAICGAISLMALVAGLWLYLRKGRGAAKGPALAR
jgi:hypothetical protein